MAYDAISDPALRSSGWNVFVNVISALSVAIYIIFGTIHLFDNTCGKSKKRRQSWNRDRNRYKYQKRLQYATSTFFLWNAVVGSVIICCYLLIDIDKSLEDCSWVYNASTVYNMMNNYILYLFLIAKSRLYDPMNQMKTLYHITFWMMNIGFIPIFGTVIYNFFTHRESEVIDGQEHCVEEIEYYFVLWILILDSIVSLLTMLVVAGPTLFSKLSKDVKANVIRTIALGSVAMISTFIYFLMIFIHAKQRGKIILKPAMELGSLDITLNFLCVIACWPYRFYEKTIKKIILKIRGVKDTNLIVVRRNSKKAGISTGRNFKMSKLSKTIPHHPKSEAKRGRISMDYSQSTQAKSVERIGVGQSQVPIGVLGSISSLTPGGMLSNSKLAKFGISTQSSKSHTRGGRDE
ncbi:hypothetical protein AAMO2058_000988200 [Amorphochlora amoebiformis]